MDRKMEAIDALKAMAEMTYIFFKHLLETGATMPEATAMTSAYISALLSNPGAKSTEEGEAG